MHNMLFIAGHSEIVCLAKIPPYFRSLFLLWFLLFQLYMVLFGHLLASKKDYWFLPKNSDINLGTYLFKKKNIFIYYNNSEDLNKQNLVAFFVLFLKIQFWKEAKISWKFVPICYTSKLTVFFGGVKYFFQRL